MTSLPEIPVVTAAEAVALLPSRVDDLFAQARRRYTALGLGLGDALSRRWLERNANPYLGEINAVATAVRRPGAHLLNCSYEWACTSGVRAGADGDSPLLLRVLDWDLDGLGRNLSILRQRGPAGPWLNLGWPGFVGAITAVAPGRFAAAINQPPMPSRGLGLAGDWATSRAPVWASRALPPAHLMRQVFDEAPDYDRAVAILRDTPISTPAFFTVAGAHIGQGCVIERTQDDAAVRPADPIVAVANDWVALSVGGTPRGHDSDGRRHQMERTLASDPYPFAMRWLSAPILNHGTRMALVTSPADGRIALVGLETGRQATRLLSME